MNFDANRIPSQTTNPTAFIDNDSLPVDMVEEASLLEVEANPSAEYLNGIQIDDDTMVIDLLCSLDDDDDDSNDDMSEEGFEIIDLALLRIPFCCRPFIVLFSFMLEEAVLFVLSFAFFV
jgi:hypothetical protein